MSKTPRPRKVLITHTGGEFLVRFNHSGTEDEALAFAADQVAERWDMDVEDVHIATDEDIQINEAQWTDLRDEV